MIGSLLTFGAVLALLAQTGDSGLDLPFPTTLEGWKNLGIALLAGALVKVAREAISGKLLTRTLVAGVARAKPHMRAWIEARPELVQALAGIGMTPDALANYLGDAIERGIQGLALEAKIEAKLNPIVKATKERVAVDANGEAAKS